jgi:hypothetical protein
VPVLNEVLAILLAAVLTVATLGLVLSIASGLTTARRFTLHDREHANSDEETA